MPAATQVKRLAHPPFPFDLAIGCNGAGVFTARAAIEQFNERLLRGRTILSWPTIEAVLLSRHHWMAVYCRGCQTVRDVDLRVVPRPPEATLREVLLSLRCKSPCRGRAPVPRAFGLSVEPGA